MKKDKKTLDFSLSRPPVVVVLGHVDHGKTTLLDSIRQTSVAAKEHGGITQHIGAYQTNFKTQNSELRTLTFIDTPGHEVFSKMRSRGAQIADIAILVVASDDSVKPQTKESIEQIKQANIPFIVAVNKIDLPGAHIDKVKQDLAKAGVQVEGFGGDVPLVPISAKTGAGVPVLLDMIILVMAMKGLPDESGAPFEAVVIETRIDKGKGLVSSVIVQRGTLTARMKLFEYAKEVGRVRAIFDEYGKAVPKAGPGTPVEVLGFTMLPSVGSVLRDIKRASEEPPKSQTLASEQIVPETLPDYLQPVFEEKTLNVIIKADTAGSLEALKASFDKRVIVVSSGVGDISDADILLAKSSKSIILGLHIGIGSSVQKLAQTEKVVFRTYRIIYELINELDEVVKGLKEVLIAERELGKGQIIAEFPYEETRIAGVKVVSGRLARGDTVRIERNDAEVIRVKIKSIRQGKEEKTRIDAGEECGVLFDKKVDFTLGDGIIAITTG